MLKHPRPLQVALFILLLLVLLVVFTILVRNIMQDNTVGMDYSIYWTAGREVFLEHHSPYSDELALQNQMRVLRRASRPDEDQMAFAYPPYALLLGLPFTFMNFDYAQAAWLVLNLLIIIATSVWAYAKRTPTPAGSSPGIATLPTSRLARWSISLNIIAQLAFYPFTFALILGNFVVSMVAILLLAFAILHRGDKLTHTAQIILGVALAWATGKPQAVWLFILLLLAFAWKLRWRTLLVSFFAGLAGFIGISFLLVPGWPWLWLERIQKYTTYIGKVPIGKLHLQAFLPDALSSWIAAIEIIALLGLAVILFWRWWHNRISLFPLLAWLGLTTYLIHPQVVSYSQTVFLIPFILWVLLDVSIPLLTRGLVLAGQIIASWGVFFWGLTQPGDALFDEARLIFYLLWMLWLFVPQGFHRSRVLAPGNPE
jgi:hypothetical protein